MLRTALRLRAMHAQLRVASRGAGGARLGAARCGEATAARWQRTVQAPVLCVGKHRKKGDLPSKVCVHCNRPFNWRKKWEACWDEVKFCSAACRASAKKGERKPQDEVPLLL